MFGIMTGYGIPFDSVMDMSLDDFMDLCDYLKNKENEVKPISDAQREMIEENKREWVKQKSL